MSERDNILARIREALRVPAPRPHAPAHLSTTGPQTPREWLPCVGNTFDEQLALFRKNATDLKADFSLLENEDQLLKVLLQLRDRAAWKKIGSHHGELTGLAMRALGLPVCLTDTGYEVNELESCDAAITECDALVAQTGSVLLTARSAGGRALSVLPPHHIVLARRRQFVADLPDALQLLKSRYAQKFPSFLSFITGPSRTGDIERILVLGAHGPRQLTILCY